MALNVNVLNLTQDLINIPSVTRWSNEAISDYLEGTLKQQDFTVERLEYTDDNGERKVSLVAQKGEGDGGLAFFSHSDTVPGQELDWDAFSATIEDGRVIGRGSCDMKGPLAATLVAVANVAATKLHRAVYVVICADEEAGGGGAKQVTAESQLLQAAPPQYGVVAEPTHLIPVYAHKGGCMVEVTAYGEAAHTSTDKGISANFLMVPFLADMRDLAEQIKTDSIFQDDTFTPPTCGFNIVLNDGGTRPNVTAAKTVCTVAFRTMPNAHNQELRARIVSQAESYGFEVNSHFVEPFYTNPQAKIVQTACHVSSISQPQTVPFGTDAFYLDKGLELVVFGPGHITQAHTVGEWIATDQLHQAVNYYEQMIELLCI